MKKNTLYQRFTVGLFYFLVISLTSPKEREGGCQEARRASSPSIFDWNTFTPKSKSSKIRHFTRQWLSTSPVSRHNTSLCFSPLLCLLHPAPAPCPKVYTSNPDRRLVGPKPSASGRSGQTLAMLLSLDTFPVKDVASAVVKANLSEAF